MPVIERIVMLFAGGRSADMSLVWVEPRLVNLCGSVLGFDDIVGNGRAVAALGGRRQRAQGTLHFTVTRRG